MSSQSPISLGLVKVTSLHIKHVVSFNNFIYTSRMSLQEIKLIQNKNNLFILNKNIILQNDFFKE